MYRSALVAMTACLAFTSLASSPALAARKVKVYRDQAAYNWVSSIIAKLATSMGVSPRSIDLTLVDMGQMNAFAGPEGDIYVTRGLINAVDSDDELAAVLAHELVHVVKDHAAKSQQASTLGSLGGSLLGGLLARRVGGNIGNMAGNLGRMAGGMGSLKVARDEEREADELGFRNMVKAGYSPRGFISVFQKLSADQGGGRGGGGGGQFSSHPDTNERLTRAHQWTQRLPDNVQDRKMQLTLADHGGGRQVSQAAPRRSGRARARSEYEYEGYAADDEYAYGRPDQHDAYAVRSARSPASSDGWRTVRLKNGRLVRVRSSD